MANSAIRTDNLPLAKEYIDRLLEVEPNKDLSHWVCYRYAITVEDYPAAISELEKCISLDRSDADYYLAMAGLICDELYARDPLSGSIVKIDEDETNEYAVPFALTALTVSPQSATRVLDFLRRNNFKSYIDPVSPFIPNFASSCSANIIVLSKSSSGKLSLSNTSQT